MMQSSTTIHIHTCHHEGMSAVALAQSRERKRENMQKKKFTSVIGSREYVYAHALVRRTVVDDAHRLVLLAPL